MRPTFVISRHDWFLRVTQCVLCEVRPKAEETVKHRAFSIDQL